MKCPVFLCVICFCLQDLVSCMSLQLLVPSHVREGGQAVLGCQYELQQDQLYSVKWYKDGREFFRYVPRNVPPLNYFQAPGVSVDISESSSNVVVLRDLTAESAGLFRCEVAGEGPRFNTVYDQADMHVYFLPESPPVVTGLRDSYQMGDRAVFNCSAAGSRPETQLRWWINDQVVPRSYLQGPWYRVSMDRSDAIETSLQLRFPVNEDYFRDGFIKLKCQATIAPLYQDEVVLKILVEQPTRPEPALTEDRPSLLAFDQLDDGDDGRVAVVTYGTSAAVIHKVPVAVLILFLSLFLL